MTIEGSQPIHARAIGTAHIVDSHLVGNFGGPPITVANSLVRDSSVYGEASISGGAQVVGSLLIGPIEVVGGLVKQSVVLPGRQPVHLRGCALAECSVAGGDAAILIAGGSLYRTRAVAGAQITGDPQIRKSLVAGSVAGAARISESIVEAGAVVCGRASVVGTTVPAGAHINGVADVRCGDHLRLVDGPGGPVTVYRTRTRTRSGAAGIGHGLLSAAQDLAAVRAAAAAVESDPGAASDPDPLYGDGPARVDQMEGPLR